MYVHMSGLPRPTTPEVEESMVLLGILFFIRLFARMLGI